MARRGRWVAGMSLIAGLLSLLTWPGPRRLVMLHVQQVLPARAGATFFSIWRTPDSPHARDESLPFWRHWKSVFRKRAGDWRIHAARAFCPSPAWQCDSPWNERITTGFHEWTAREQARELEESIPEYAAARRLAPDRPEFAIAPTVMRLACDPRLEMGRLACTDKGIALAPDGEPPALASDEVSAIFAGIAKAKSLDPDNGFPWLIEAHLLLVFGRDEEALDALDSMAGKPVIQNYAQRLACNYVDFLVSIGTPRLEASRDLSRGGSWHRPAAQLVLILGLLGHASMEHGDHARAVRCFRYAVFACDGLKTGCGPEWNELHVLRHIGGSNDSGLTDIEAQWEVARPYLLTHSGEDAACRIEKALAVHRNWQAGQPLHKRRVVTAMLGYGALFTGPLVLLHVALLGGILLVLRGRRMASATPIGIQAKAAVHACCLIFSAGIFLIACKTGEPHWIERFVAGDHWEVPVILWYFLPVPLMCFAGILVAAIGAKDFRASLRAWPTVAGMHLLPTALVYCGFLYVLSTWAAFILRLDMMKWLLPPGG